jgi:hypothetical protein
VPFELFPLGLVVPLVTTGAMSFMAVLEERELNVEETMTEAASAESFRSGRMRLNSFETGEKGRDDGRGG